jgi:hypothetical protein
LRPRLANALLVGIGFILSPLSWWNDAVVNVPLAYAFSYPFSLLSPQLFLPSFVLGYWLTNVLGFVLLHLGGEGMVYKSRATISVKRSLAISTIYTIIIIVLGLAGWLTPPSRLLAQLQ